MSFDTAWLDLREPADHAARDGTLLARAQEHLAGTYNPLVVDLGCGTGSTFRALGAVSTKWLLIDHDEALLAEARRRCGADVSTVALDLGDPRCIPLDVTRLVTASALIDLVSAEWIDAFVERLAAKRVGLYSALNYDGIMQWVPDDAADSTVVTAFNRHQHGDKGFGPALGPQGGSHLTDALRRHGFAVTTAPSPWILDRSQAELQSVLLKGIAGAAIEAGCSEADGWLNRRLDALPNLRGRIGHLDVLALPA